MNYYLEVLKKYADFNGRARRSEYWYFALFSTLVSIILLLTIFISPSMVFGFLIYTLAIIIPTMAVAVRRMHDVNKSGWFLLIPVYSLILVFTNGTRGPNEYGDDPKNPEYIDEVEQIGNNA